MILEDQIKQANEDLVQARENLKKVRPPTATMRRDIKRISVLENQLDQALLRYNKVQTANKQLRGEIDVLRKNQRNQLRVNRELLADIQTAADEARKLSVSTQAGARVADETKNQILALKANHEERKGRFESQIKGLTGRLNEKDETEEIVNNENVQTTANSGKVDKEQHFSNPTALLKLRLTKWEQHNREKKHLMDLYLRNTRVVEDAFQQI